MFFFSNGERRKKIPSALFWQPQKAFVRLLAIGYIVCLSTFERDGSFRKKTPEWSERLWVHLLKTFCLLVYLYGPFGNEILGHDIIKYQY